MAITRRPVEWLDRALRSLLPPVPRHLGSNDRDRRLFVQLAAQLHGRP